MRFDLTKFLPRPAQRYKWPELHGSSDALALTAAANELKRRSQMLVVITARVSDARRLKEEIEWFMPAVGEDLSVRILADWETLPYDAFSPHQDLVSERLATLYEVTRRNTDILIVPATTALLRMAPVPFVAGHTFFFRAGEKINEDALRHQLTIAGYNHVSQVMTPGEYSVRGSLIDIFPMGSALPYRLDLFGDELESIKTFDVDTQRSLYAVNEIRMLPGREFPLDENARAFFRSRWREKFEGDPSLSVIYRDIAGGIASAGIEYYLPLFFEHTATIFEYVPENTVFALCGNVNDAIERFWSDTKTRYSFLKSDRERPVLPPEDIFLTAPDFFTLMGPHARIAVTAEGETSELSSPLPEIEVDRKADDPLNALKRMIERQQKRTLICAESAGRRETMLQLFSEYNLDVAVCDDFKSFMESDEPVMLTVSPLRRGFSLGYIFSDVTVVTETELYAHMPGRRRGKKTSSDFQFEAVIKDLSELKVGDAVVHAHHGVGRYNGLVAIDTEEGPTEFLQIRYANNASLYVPVSQPNVISRYAGASGEDAPLHTLGSGQWEKARSKAAKRIFDTAAELLDLYAKRAMRKGHAFELGKKDYDKFADSFGFEETADQTAAIEAVISDMVSDKPMDRLICGDVGFGKTEVALRAAFVAVMGGKQVALLAPTTLLAEQHAQTFKDRFADWPVRIAELSRFRTKKETQATIDGLNDGTIDIVIGTHKLLTDAVSFDRLGLIIIDEEHRFGVSQKEALKQMRVDVDVLTLTATPIPRTLSMALDGIRDFSVIATAPQKRLAIKTFVRTEDNSTIREACLRELKRGGQVYFLHNEVDTIENRREMLQELLPEARIGVAHGQMHERELERVMKDFVAHRYNILLCTTIIETGIDVPNANTMIMHRADKFGLAQLHQLRGRIGRSHHQAYAYLLVHDKQSLSQKAHLRLEAIRQMEDLGSGFFLAMHDLEIRGAGEVLGKEQSGEMMEIGFQMYSEMLKEAISSMKEGKEPDFDAPFRASTEINLHASALLPQDYCPGVNERLALYKRFSMCETEDEIRDMTEELVDRFGKLPEAALGLIETHRLRLLAKTIGIEKIDAHSEAVSIHFAKDAAVDPVKVISLIQNDKNVRLNGPDKLKVFAKMTNIAERAAKIRETVKQIANSTAEIPEPTPRKRTRSKKKTK